MSLPYGGNGAQKDLEEYHNRNAKENICVSKEIGSTILCRSSDGAMVQPGTSRRELGAVWQVDDDEMNACEEYLHGLSVADSIDGLQATVRCSSIEQSTSDELLKNHKIALQKLSSFNDFLLDTVAPDTIENDRSASHRHNSNHTGNIREPSGISEEMDSGTKNPLADDQVWVPKFDTCRTSKDHHHSSSPTVLDCASDEEKSENQTINQEYFLARKPELSAVVDIPGPCEPEDLIEGIIFSANYLGTTQLSPCQNELKDTRKFQAQEALRRIKVVDGESQPSAQVDLFISTSKIKILNADNQQSMMSHTLRSITYVADIGDILVIMAKSQQIARCGSNLMTDEISNGEVQKQSKTICHVLLSVDSHLISESAGQCFNIAYQQFLLKNSIEPQFLSQSDFGQFLDAQEMYHDDLLHYSKKENTKEIWVEKTKGESMGIAIVESGWGSIVPTVILANLQHNSPFERNGKFSIGDQIMSINGMSLVGLPLQTCQTIIKGLKDKTLVRVNIVSCPPVVSVLIKRPDLKHQLGFSVQNGVICSLMRGGIAERGGVRVGHRIIEINQQSVVATPHDKIVQTLITSVGEIQMKTMPSSMYRLLTGQEQPVFL